MVDANEEPQMQRNLLTPIRLNILSTVLLLVLLFLGWDSVCRADHPDREHRPTGKPEEMLSGVYINSSAYHSLRNEAGVLIEPMPNVLETLGEPLKVVKKNKCESNHVWKQGEVLLEVGSGCIFQKVQGKNVLCARGAYSVEVWGLHPQGAIGITGRGLALGDSIVKMQRLYGTHCECGRYVSGTGTQNTRGEHYEYYARYQWGENVELDVDADAQGHVVHILLMGDLE
jgi:hypothetical protein